MVQEGHTVPNKRLSQKKYIYRTETTKTPEKKIWIGLPHTDLSEIRKKGNLNNKSDSDKNLHLLKKFLNWHYNQLLLHFAKPHLKLKDQENMH